MQFDLPVVKAIASAVMIVNFILVDKNVGGMMDS